VVVGIIFLIHGGQKLFVFGVGGVSHMFVSMGVPAFFAPIVAGVEFVGGIALVLGILTRWAAPLLAIDMTCAILIVHLKNGFFNPKGFEFPLSLLAACLALAISGPGAAALDHLIFGRNRSSAA
jgi:putative oxidoreductase